MPEDALDPGPSGDYRTGRAGLMGPPTPSGCRAGAAGSATHGASGISST